MKPITHRILNSVLSGMPDLYKISAIKSSYKSHCLESVEATYKDLSAQNFEFLEYAMDDPKALYRRSYELKDYKGRGIRGVMNPWPLFINSEKANEVETVAVNTKKIFDKLGSSFLMKNPSFVSTFYQVPINEVEEYFLRNSAHLETSISRGDFVDTTDGFKCLEFNISTNIGGFQGRIAKEIYDEEQILNAFVDRRMKTGYKSLDTLNLAFRHLIEYCASALKGFSGEVNVVFLDIDREHKEYSKRYLDFLKTEFKKALKDVNTDYDGDISIGYSGDLKVENNKCCHSNKHVHVILNMSFKVPPDVLSLADENNVILFNAPLTGLLGNKMSMALLSDSNEKSRTIFDEAEIKFIDKHIPWSRVIKDEDTYYNGKKVNLLKFIADNQLRLVIKAGRSYGGYDVHIGKEYSKSDWRRILQIATRRRSWIVQEYCESKSYLMQYGQFGTRLANMIWGLFVFGDKYTGNVLRLGSKSRSSVINIKQEAEVTYAMHLPS
jgi:hypothetical protein